MATVSQTREIVAKCEVLSVGEIVKRESADGYYQTFKGLAPNGKEFSGLLTSSNEKKSEYLIENFVDGLTVNAVKSDFHENGVDFILNRSISVDFFN